MQALSLEGRTLEDCTLEGCALYLAEPMGFCAGVERAINIVERVLERHGVPLYVHHEIVHNRYVVDGFKARGVIFVETLDAVPDGATLIFSAHGVSHHVQEQARIKKLQLFDATCPLVTKIHLEVAQASRMGKNCVLIGHDGHPEVEGTLGHFHADESIEIQLVQTLRDVDTLTFKDTQRPLIYASQTTLSVDETREIIAALVVRFPNIEAPRKDDICYATQNRQDALALLCKKVAILLVIGAEHSSNTRRLVEQAEGLGVRAHLIETVADLRPQWFKAGEAIGITAGASAPHVLVEAVIKRLRACGVQYPIKITAARETIRFTLPVTLRD